MKNTKKNDKQLIAKLHEESKTKSKSDVAKIDIKERKDVKLYRDLTHQQSISETSDKVHQAYLERHYLHHFDDDKVNTTTRFQNDKLLTKQIAIAHARELMLSKAQDFYCASDLIRAYQYEGGAYGDIPRSAFAYLEKLKIVALDAQYKEETNRRRYKLIDKVALESLKI